MPKKLEPDSVRIIDLPAPESPSGAVSVRYTLYRSRRRTIGFRVDSTGISVLAPMRAPIRLIEMSLVRNSSWVIKHLAVRAKQREESGIPRTVFADGGELPYRGRVLRISLSSEVAAPQIRTAERGNLELRIPASEGEDPAHLKEIITLWMKREAVRVIRERFDYVQQFAPRAAASLRLNSARTLWGSCSASGAIRLNWRLIFFDNDAIDYVAAHELAHLVEMNHSARFWAQVRTIKPNDEKARAALRTVVRGDLPL